VQPRGKRFEPFNSKGEFPTMGIPGYPKKDGLFMMDNPIEMIEHG
jgi:hypothetical protein